MEAAGLGDRAFVILAFVAAMGCGIVGGIFYAFSSFVMRALGRLPAEQGAAAMKAINVAVINPVFMLAFMGTALVCLALAGLSLPVLDGLAGKAALAGSLLYLFGCFGVTMVFNVPLNNALARAAPDREAPLWARYLKVWTAWNTVRTVASSAAAALLVAALMV
ncbi:anthrone oxygenase family protein [Emcibacter sp. SYSU 3D8]|uniref:anthrone oxygenase family protein n=1 Tax=Emcibacter sp. SYSU 3D8 TaxID=3133969 RepID=UPI0031FEC4B4